MAKIMIKLVVIITTSKDKIVRNGRMKAASTIRMMTLIVGIVNCDWSTVGSRGMSNSLIREIIVYSPSTINAYSLLSHEWWVSLIKFMVGPTIYVREGSTHL